MAIQQGRRVFQCCLLCFILSHSTFWPQNLNEINVSVKRQMSLAVPDWCRLICPVPNCPSSLLTSLPMSLTPSLPVLHLRFRAQVPLREHRNCIENQETPSDVQRFPFLWRTPFWQTDIFLMGPTKEVNEGQTE